MLEELLLEPKRVNLGVANLAGDEPLNRRGRYRLEIGDVKRRRPVRERDLSKVTGTTQTTPTAPPETRRTRAPADRLIAFPPSYRPNRTSTARRFHATH